MQITFLRKKAFFIVLPGLLALSILVSGCTATPNKTATFNASSASSQALIKNAIYLQTAHYAPNTQVVLKNSPWGESAAAQVLNQYDAASGRVCMQVKVLNTQQLALLCEVAPDYWQPVRSLSTRT